MFSNEASESISGGQFKGIELIKNSKVKTIRRGQFYASLKSNLENRCLSSEDMKFYDVLKVVYSDFWPDVLPMEFGEKELKTLCGRFLNEFWKNKDGFSRLQTEWRQKCTIRFVATFPLHTNGAS